MNSLEVSINDVSHTYCRNVSSQQNETGTHDKLICSRIQQLARGTTFWTLNFKRASEVNIQWLNCFCFWTQAWSNSSSGNWETVSAFVMSDSAGCNNWTGPEFLATLETAMLILRLGTINDWHTARSSLEKTHSYKKWGPNNCEGIKFGFCLWALFGPKVGFIYNV